jgi:flavin reductase (DIM6/NTAB) family NADH-FMN oxidoreductase RutF
MDPTHLQRALGRIASGLSIVTVRQGDEATAFLASWVQQAGFEPPMLSVAVGRDRPAARLMAAGAPWCVNVLSKDDPAGLLKHFARGFAPGADPYFGVRIVRGEGEAEALLESLASLQCQLKGSLCVGDHLLFVGEVISAISHREEGESAVHIRKNGLRY